MSIYRRAIEPEGFRPYTNVGSVADCGAERSIDILESFIKEMFNEKLFVTTSRRVSRAIIKITSIYYVATGIVYTPWRAKVSQK